MQKAGIIYGIPVFLFFFAQNTIKNYLFAFVAFAIDKFYRYML